MTRFERAPLASHFSTASPTQCRTTADHVADGLRFPPDKPAGEPTRETALVGDGLEESALHAWAQTTQ